MDIEQQSTLPPHPTAPFIRIVGEVVERDAPPGEPIPWRVATHVVCPEGAAEPLRRRARLTDRAGREVLRTADLEIPPRAPDLTRFDDQQTPMDEPYDPVVDTRDLAPGDYDVEAVLHDHAGRELARSSLPIRAGALAERLATVPLQWELPPARDERLLSGGVVRVGDLNGDGRMEIVHAVGTRHLAVYRLDGELIWRYDDPEGILIYNTASTRVWDYTGDGRAEIVACRGAWHDLRLVMLEGATGRVLRETPFPEIQQHLHILDLDASAPGALGRALWESGHRVRYVLGRHLLGAKIVVANFRGTSEPRDLLVQVGEQNCVSLVALDEHFNRLWTHHIDDGFAGHSPLPYDVDGDGRDELIVGTKLLGPDGELRWTKPFDEFAAPWEDDHVDAADAGDLDGDGEVEIAYSSRMCARASDGKTLWVDPTWHGQDVYAARMRPGDSKMQLVFCDREYRHSRHLCHGQWFDVRDAGGARLWSYRHASMHMHRMLDFNGDGLYETAFGFELQRRPTRPNVGVFDGAGRLLACLPRYGFGADVDGDGFEELVSWAQWPDVADTVDVFRLAGPRDRQGRAPADSWRACNERD